jgi:glycosyltransferase involved in cell wall biosynthesis
MSQRVLFLSHLANRSGAPIILLRFLQWLKANRDCDFSIVLNGGGELESDFAAIAPSLVMDRILGYDCHQVRAMLHRHAEPIAAWLDRFTLRHGLEIAAKPDLIYANSIANAEVLETLPWADVPVLCHVHELEFSLRHNIGLDYFARVKKRVNRYIAVSSAVRQNLIENHQIAPADVELIYGFAPTNNMPDKISSRAKVIRELNLPDDAILIAGSGAIGWLKGTDLFVQLAGKTIARKPELPIYFLWIGSDQQALPRGQMSHDIRLLGLESRVILCGLKPNPLEYFAACDVFALTSREDSFPLVGLEAAAVGTAILCFEKAGGMPEFVGKDCGVVVDYLDVDAMADAIVRLVQSPVDRQTIAANAREKVCRENDVSVIAPQIANCMQRMMGASPDVKNG